MMGPGILILFKKIINHKYPSIPEEPTCRWINPVKSFRLLATAGFLEGSRKIGKVWRIWPHSKFRSLLSFNLFSLVKDKEQ
jgi:hypothetical protein